MGTRRAKRRSGSKRAAARLRGERARSGRTLVERAWLERVRMKSLAWLVAGVVTAWGLIALTALPAAAVVGVTFAAVAMVVRNITSPMKQDACWSCRADLEGAPAGLYGAICPSCGAINVRNGRGDGLGDTGAMLAAGEGDEGESV